MLKWYFPSVRPPHPFAALGLLVCSLSLIGCGSSLAPNLSSSPEPQDINGFTKTSNFLENLGQHPNGYSYVSPAENIPLANFPKTSPTKARTAIQSTLKHLGITGAKSLNTNFYSLLVRRLNSNNLVITDKKVPTKIRINMQLRPDLAAKTLIPINFLWTHKPGQSQRDQKKKLDQFLTPRQNSGRASETETSALNLDLISSPQSGVSVIKDKNIANYSLFVQCLDSYCLEMVILLKFKPIDQQISILSLFRQVNFPKKVSLVASRNFDLANAAKAKQGSDLSLLYQIYQAQLNHKLKFSQENLYFIDLYSKVSKINSGQSKIHSNLHLYLGALQADLTQQGFSKSAKYKNAASLNHSLRNIEIKAPLIDTLMFSYHLTKSREVFYFNKYKQQIPTQLETFLVGSNLEQQNITIDIRLPFPKSQLRTNGQSFQGLRLFFDSQKSIDGTQKSNQLTTTGKNSLNPNSNQPKKTGPGKTMPFTSKNNSSFDLTAFSNHNSRWLDQWLNGAFNLLHSEHPHKRSMKKMNQSLNEYKHSSYPVVQRLFKFFVTAWTAPKLVNGGTSNYQSYSFCTLKEENYKTLNVAKLTSDAGGHKKLRTHINRQGAELFLKQINPLLPFLAPIYESQDLLIDFSMILALEWLGKMQNYNTSIVNPLGPCHAGGPFQICYKTGQDLNDRVVDGLFPVYQPIKDTHSGKLTLRKSDARRNLLSSAFGSAAYLRDQIDTLKLTHDPILSLSAYYYGGGNLSKWRKQLSAESNNAKETPVSKNSHLQAHQDQLSPLRHFDVSLADLLHRKNGGIPCDAIRYTFSWLAISEIASKPKKYGFTNVDDHSDKFTTSSKARPKWLKLPTYLRDQEFCSLLPGNNSCT